MINQITTSEPKRMIGAEVIGIDGCRSPYKGTVKELSIYEHSVLGTLAQVWVEWDGDNGHLTPYFPRQFEKWNGQSKIGVYIVKGAN